MKKNVLSVFGTRPEAIKMAPLVKQLESDDRFESRVCVTAQHRDMLDQVLNIFDIQPDFDFNLMQKNQSLSSISSKILAKMPEVYRNFYPDIVLVHGDTPTTFAAALSAFNEKIHVGHVEAGLRTGNIKMPWPEEANRRLTSTICNLHFAPTTLCQENLLKEGISSKDIFITGNSIIDALMLGRKIIDTDNKISSKLEEKFSYLDNDGKLILVTGHRRENFGEGFKNICMSIFEIATRNRDVQIVYPVHLNPNVQKPVREYLGNLANVYLIEPLEYLAFIFLMDKSHIILTDSGGIQEEAPSLGKPVLVMRDVTERAEAVNAGTVKLVGTSKDRILMDVEDLLYNEDSYHRMSIAHNPYGDGKTSERICEILLKY